VLTPLTLHYSPWERTESISPMLNLTPLSKRVPLKSAPYSGGEKEIFFQYNYSTYKILLEILKIF